MEKQYRSIDEILEDIKKPDADLEKLEAELKEVTEAREAEKEAIETGFSVDEFKLILRRMIQQDMLSTLCWAMAATMLFVITPMARKAF